MATIIKDEKKLTKKGESYFWEQSFISELTKEDVKNYKENIELNIKKIEKDMREKDIRKLLQVEENKLEAEFKTKHEALSNFDQYWQEILQEQETRKEDEKKNIKQQVAMYEEIKKTHLANKKKQFLDDKKMMNDELIRNRNNYEYYKAVVDKDEK